VAVFDLVSRGRGDTGMVGKWSAEGAARFQSDDGDKVIDRAVNISKVTIKSPTAQRIIQLDTVKAWMGDQQDEETLAIVEKELEENVTIESMSPPKIEPKAPDGKEEDKPEDNPANENGSQENASKEGEVVAD
jgi:hypothetical protein